MKLLKAVKGYAYLLMLALLFPGVSQADAPQKILSPNTWEQLSIPAMSVLETFETLLGNSLPQSSYEIDWIIYRYVSGSGVYEVVPLDASPHIGESYWIIQITESDVTLALPNGIIELEPMPSVSCGAEQYCTTLYPYSQEDVPHWSMLGIPFSHEFTLSEARVSSPFSDNPCFLGCSFDEAVELELIGPGIFSYDSSINDYVPLSSESIIRPWDGLWLLTLGGGTGFELYIPRDTGTVPSDDEDGLIYVTIASSFVQYSAYEQPRFNGVRLPYGIPDPVLWEPCAIPHYSLDFSESTDGILVFEAIRMLQQQSRIVGFSREQLFTESPTFTNLQYPYFSSVTRMQEIHCDVDFPNLKQYVVPVSALD